MLINDPNLKPQIIYLPKYAGKNKSVDQLVIEDYGDFKSIVDNVNHDNLVMDRFKFVEYVVNNFISKEKCVYKDCDKAAQFISIYTTPERIPKKRNNVIEYDDITSRVNNGGYVYCSYDHFNNDSGNKHTDFGEATLEPINFRTAICDTRYQTDDLVKRIGILSMGMTTGKKTKEYLRDFFNNAELYKPYEFAQIKTPLKKPDKSDNNSGQQNLFF